MVGRTAAAASCRHLRRECIMATPPVLLATGPGNHSNQARSIRLDQSGLAPANFTTLPHFSVSSATSLPKSAAEPASTMPPSSVSRALILGSANAALILALSLSTISGGVPLGAATPYQALASKPGTKSPTVGTSGSAGERAAVATAKARTLPALTY